MTTTPPKSKTPRRIAFLGWARLSAQAAEGTGYNFAASELAAGLRLAGHTVFALTSGMRYRPTPGSKIRKLETWRGIECFDLINSAIPAPAAVNFGNVLPEMSSPSQDELVVRWLDKQRIDLVHVHSLEGQSMSLLKAIKDSGRTLMVTMHNYWFVCPQVDLLHGSLTPCFDYEGGKRCETCMPHEDVAKRKLRRSGAQAAQAVVGHAVTDAARSAAIRAVAAVKGATPELDEFTQLRSSRPPDALWAGFDTEAAGESDGQIAFQLPDDPLAKPIPQATPTPAGGNERMLRADHHLNVLNDFGKRRTAGIEALSCADKVIFPSEFNRSVHVRMGLDRDKTLIHPYGMPHFDIINRRARRQAGYEHTPWTPESPAPLRLAFFGSVRPNKGLHVLLHATDQLEPAIRQRMHILIRASGHDTPARRHAATYPELEFIGGYDTMQLVSATSAYDVGLLPHIWFDNSPLVMWEHLHAGRFTIASELGGASDTINHSQNGCLIPAGDASALASQLASLVTGETQITPPNQVHDATTLTSYRDAVQTTCDLYDELAN